MPSVIFKIICICAIVLIESPLFGARWSELRERDFTLRNTSGSVGVNIYGDFNVTGAPIMCPKNSNNSQCNWTTTNGLTDITGQYLTSDNQITLNSSSADLTVPSDATITKAYLYWNGHIYGTNPNNYSSAIQGYNTVTFKTPDNTEHTITANINDTTKVNYYAYINDQGSGQGFRHFYQATVDVTNIVLNGGYNPSNKKTFTVGNLKTTSGKDSVGIAAAHRNWTSNTVFGPMGGWSLIVEYTRPVNSGQKYKNVSIYDGFKFVIGTQANPNPTVNIPITGILTPLTGTVNANFVFYAMGGDRGVGGNTYPEWVSLRNKTSVDQKLLQSTINPINNFLNSTISFYGNTLTNQDKYSTGIDLDVFNNQCRKSNGDAVACIENNQTSTNIGIHVTYNNGGTDQSFFGMTAFSVDIYQPDISSFQKDSNTSSTQSLYPGDSVKYTLDFNNSGTEAAENITIYDTFSSSVGGDMLLDIIDRNATAIKNSIRLKTFSEANYHCAIGSTDPECTILQKDANCSVDYSDNNTSKATKVWCNNPYMAVNDRKLMQFSVKVRDDYNQSLSEQNVTNIAYSHYYNAATHEEITVLGQSNINTAGTVGGMVAYNSIMDTVDSYDNTYNYNILSGLKTKIANSANNLLEAVYLGDNPSNPQPSIYSSNAYDMLVLFRLSDNTCTEDANLSNLTDVTATFSQNGNQYTAVSNPFTFIPQTKRNAKVKMHFIDWNKISLNLVGNNCTHNSSITGNLKGVPQCLNGNEDKISNLVTVDVTECITAPVGKDAPCNSEAYNNSGSKGNIYPTKYNNMYGCLMCLSDKVNGANNCSRDNFAIRPNTFYSNIATNQTFIAEQNTTITFQANQVGGVGTLGYNEIMGTSFNVDINISDNNKSCIQPSISLNPIIIFADGNNTGSYTFGNVGDFNLTMHENNGSEYAVIDSDDTTDSNRLITPFIQPIKIVPHHFDLNGSFTNAGNNFTYLSNFETFTTSQDRNMSAMLDINVSAKGFNGGNLSNYSSTCYAKDGNLSLILPSALSIFPANALSKMLWFDELHPDTNGTELLSGTSYIIDLNATQFDSGSLLGGAQTRYRINFDRNTTIPVNPFLFTIQGLSVTNSDLVSGTGNIDQNTTAFYYGRAHAPDYRFSGNSGTATIYYEVYTRDLNQTQRQALGITGLQGIDSVFWYQNILHVNTNGTINPTSSTITIGTPSHNATTLLPVSHAAPHIGTIQLNSSAWLQHYPTYFTAEFSSIGSWAGEGSVDRNTSKNVGKYTNEHNVTRSNRRLNW